MDKKVTLIYDRIENDKFVPNGWSRDCEYFPDTGPEAYCQRYNVEPIVWFQLGLDASNTYNSIIPKLADEVDENFIYPVEQFGGIEKLTGEEIKKLAELQEKIREHSKHRTISDSTFDL